MMFVYNFTHIYSNTQRVAEVQLANSLLRGGCIQASKGILFTTSLLSLSYR